MRYYNTIKTRILLFTMLLIIISTYLIKTHQVTLKNYPYIEFLEAKLSGLPKSFAVNQINQLQINHARLAQGQMAPQKCNTELAVSTHYFSGKASCINLIQLFIKSGIEVPAFLDGTKITSAQNIDGNWVITLNSGYVVTVNNSMKKIISITDIRSLNFKFGTFGGVVSSHFENKNIGYFYYTEERNKRHALIFEKINFEKGVIKGRLPLIITNESFDLSDLGGGIISDGDNILLAIGKGVSSAFVSPLANRVQDDAFPFGKIIEIPISQFNKKESYDFLTYSIFSKGHKNPQGLAYEYGNIFEVEHGPYGGDEINLLSRGMNYGWNKYSYGYDDARGVVLDNYESSYVEPLYYFLPSIGISDVSGCPFGIGSLSFAYKPCLVISSLRGQSLFIVKFNKQLINQKQLTPDILPSVINIENIFIGERVRHIRSGTMEITVFTDLLNIYTIKFHSNFLK